MQRVPSPGGSISELNNFCMLASPGASLLRETDTQLDQHYYTVCNPGQRCGRSLPDEGHLVLIHPGVQLQAGVLSKGRDDEAEDESDADEDGGEDNLDKDQNQI